MKLHCAKCGKLCLVILPDRDRPYQYDFTCKIVCGKCLECYRTADSMAKMARAEAQKMPEFFADLFEKKAT